MEALAVAIQPTGALRLHGSGDRSAWSPGPGALPGEEPLLPRLETLIGMLANTAYRAGCAPSHGCKDWCSCSLAAAARLLYGVVQAGSAVLMGPFLVAETTTKKTKETRVYINASTGLLDLKGLSGWVRAAELLAEAAGALPPARVSRLHDEAQDILKELERKGYFIPAQRLASRHTSITLDPWRKGTRHGLIYSLARVDLRSGLEAVLAGQKARVKRVWIVALSMVRDQGHAPCLVKWAGSLGPRSTPVYAVLWRLKGLHTSDTDPEWLQKECTEHLCIALTLAPVSSEHGWADFAVHPWPPRPGLEVYARAYSSNGPGFAKDRPLPGYWPGTILQGYIDPGSMCREDNGLPELLHTLSLKTLQEVTRALIDSWSLNITA